MQSKRMSFVESCTNIAIGYGVSVITNAVVLPLFGLHPSTADNFLIGAVFTVVSLIRSYALRRVFNGAGRR